MACSVSLACFHHAARRPQVPDNAGALHNRRYQIVSVGWNLASHATAECFPVVREKEEGENLVAVARFYSVVSLGSLQLGSAGKSVKSSSSSSKPLLHAGR